MKEFAPKTSKIFIGLYLFFVFGAAMGDWKVVNNALGALPKIISAGALGLAFAVTLHIHLLTGEHGR